MKKYAFLSALAFVSQSYAGETVKESMLIDGNKLEIVRIENDDWSVDEVVRLDGKDVVKIQAGNGSIYAYHDQVLRKILIISDCGADSCRFRAITLADGHAPTITELFGNGSDRPSIASRGDDIVIEFDKTHRSTPTKILIKSGIIQK